MEIVKKEESNVYLVQSIPSYKVSMLGSGTNWDKCIDLIKCAPHKGPRWGDPLKSEEYNYILLGGNEDVKNLIKSKINTNPVSSFKKVYFDKLCKYPRFKVKELTSISRSLKPLNVDSCIITPIEFQEYNYWYKGKLKYDILVGFSKSSNSYYFINETDYSYSNSTLEAFYKQKLSQFSNLDPQNSLLSALIADKILPIDTIPYYQGKIIVLKNNEYEYVNNIINNYTQITYDTELDKFINTNLQKLTSSEIKEIDKMLKSPDDTVVGMGMKLLSNFDIDSSRCILAILILNHWNNIVDNSTFKSVGFQQVLKSVYGDYSKINVDSRTSRYKYLNSVYGTSTNSDDKKYAKDFAKDKILSVLNSQADSFMTILSNFGFKITISIE